MTMIEILHIVLPVLLIASAIVAVLFRDLLASAIALAVMSLLLSLEFYCNTIHQTLENLIQSDYRETEIQERKRYTHKTQ